MKLFIIAAGKQHDVQLRDYIASFESRLLPDVQLTWELVPASGASNPDEARIAESTALLQRLKPQDTVVLLDERGVMPDNHQFAEKFEQWSGKQGRLVFIIGGAFGVGDVLRERATYMWSFSPLVLPHQLVRALLVEQLYRTKAILSNHPYHHI